MLIALGEIAPGDYFATRLYEAEPLVVTRPTVLQGR